jgi:tetratricopeptide (TPR) repeat protein
MPPAHTADRTASTPAVGMARSRLWLFRVAAMVLAPLLVLALVQGILALAGFGYPTSFFLPGRVDTRDAVIQNDRFGWRFFGSTMSRTPCPLLFDRVKPKDAVRIFVLGESAAYGDPQPAFGLARVLEVLLSHRYPGVRFEVVNAAMTAINSHAFLPIARDCAGQQGDLWVIYMGNNEVVGPYGAGTVFGPQAPRLALIRASLAFKATRAGQWLDAMRERLSRRPASASEWGGMMMFVKHQVSQDDPRMKAVYGHFERNLSDILAAGVRSGARIVVSTVASNLKDCAPFASMHRPGLSEAQQAEWEQLFQAGVAAQKASRYAQAAESYGRAAQIDDRFAELQFRWAQCCLASGQDAEARQRFVLARDYDCLRFRCDSQLNDLIRKAAQGRDKEGILLADGEQALSQGSPNGLPGEELLYEHVHLRFEGNYLLARTIAAQAERLLPDRVTQGAKTEAEWLPPEECAQHLAWTDWDRYQAWTSILVRLNDPPFTTQMNHAEQCQRIQAQIERLLPAVQAPALQQSIATVRKALAESPDDRFLYESLGTLLSKTEDLAGACEAWQQVSHLLPHYVQAYCQTGLLLVLQKRYDEAVQSFNLALRLEPDSFTAIEGLANTLAHQGKNQEAVALYDKVLRIKPNYSPTHISLGLALKALGRTQEAEAQFRQATQSPVNTAASFQSLGKVCFDQGWMEEAVANFTKALRLDPTDAAIHVNLGMALASLRRYPEAQKHYAEAVRLNPTLAEAHFRLGFELGRQGKDAEALSHFAEALRLKPDLKEARVNLGVALMHLGRTGEAIQQFEEVLRTDPTNPTALKNLKALRGNPP